METERSRHDRDEQRKQAPVDVQESYHTQHSQPEDAEGRTIETYLTTHPKQTVYVRASNDKLATKGIRRGDVVAIDMALSEEARPGDVVLLCTADDTYLLQEWQPRSRGVRSTEKQPIVIGVTVSLIRPGRSSVAMRP